MFWISGKNWGYVLALALLICPMTLLHGEEGGDKTDAQSKSSAGDGAKTASDKVSDIRSKFSDAINKGESLDELKKEAEKLKEELQEKGELTSAENEALQNLNALLTKIGIYQANASGDRRESGQTSQEPSEPMSEVIKMTQLGLAPSNENSLADALTPEGNSHSPPAEIAQMGSTFFSDDSHLTTKLADTTEQPASALTTTRSAPLSNPITSFTSAPVALAPGNVAPLAPIAQDSTQPKSASPVPTAVVNNSPEATTPIPSGKDFNGFAGATVSSAPKSSSALETFSPDFFKGATSSPTINVAAASNTPVASGPAPVGSPANSSATTIAKSTVGSFGFDSSGQPFTRSRDKTERESTVALISASEPRGVSSNNAVTSPSNTSSNENSYSSPSYVNLQNVTVAKSPTTVSPMNSYSAIITAGPTNQITKAVPIETNVAIVEKFSKTPNRGLTPTSLVGTVVSIDAKGEKKGFVGKAALRGVTTPSAVAKAYKPPNAVGKRAMQANGIGLNLPIVGKSIKVARLFETEAASKKASSDIEKMMRGK